MEIVRVHHVGLDSSDGSRHVLGIDPTGEHGAARRRAAERVARALEELDVVAVASHQTRDVRDRALLAALKAVAVMEQEDAQRP